MEIEKVLLQLQEFKQLPTYQFERRIDAFIHPFLEQFINDSLKCSGKYKMIYPEFPLSIDLLGNKLHANYADYLFYNSEERKAFFLEFKTDSTSVNKSQFEYYCEKCHEGWPSRLNFFVQKAKKKGNSQKKFVRGLLYLKNQACDLVGCEDFNPSENLLQPKVHGINDHLQPLVFNPPQDIELTFRYLAPSIAERKVEKLCAETELDKRKYYKGFLHLYKLADLTPEPLKSILKNIE